jgi:hypothetical protein
VYGNCYKATSLTYNWFDAAVKCQSDGGFLATISSLAENQWLHAYLKCLGITSVWIGLNDIVTTFNFQWIDGSTSNFRNWYPGDPTNTGGVEYCVQAFGLVSGYESRWCDFPCSNVYNSVCKYNVTAKNTTNEGMLIHHYT